MITASPNRAYSAPYPDPFAVDLSALTHRVDIFAGPQPARLGTALDLAGPPLLSRMVTEFTRAALRAEINRLSDGTVGVQPDVYRLREALDTTYAYGNPTHRLLVSCSRDQGHGLRGTVTATGVATFARGYSEAGEPLFQMSVGDKMTLGDVTLGDLTLDTRFLAAMMEVLISHPMIRIA